MTNLLRATVADLGWFEASLENTNVVWAMYFFMFSQIPSIKITPARRNPPFLQRGKLRLSNVAKQLA